MVADLIGARWSRRPIAALLAALVVASCASPADPSTVGSPETVTTSTSASAGEPSTTSGDGSAGPGGGGEGSGTTVITGSPTTVGGQVEAPQGPGSYARRYLAAGGPGALVVEVRSQSGASPAARVVAAVDDELSRASSKPVDVVTGAVSGGARQWTVDEILAVADQSTTVQTADRGVMRLLFLSGGFAESDTVVGVAVRGDVAAIFTDRVREAAGVLGSVDQMAEAVTVHEVGHLLGLVDLVLDTGRADREHPGHSSNTESVMYYAVESTLIGSILTGGPPTEFDDADRRDLDAIAGR